MNSTAKSVRPALVMWLGTVLLLTLPAGANAASPKSAARKRDAAAAERFMAEGSYRKAADLLEKSIGLEPRYDPEAYIMLATCRLNLEEPDGAIQVCERALELFPDSPRLDRFYVFLLRTGSSKRERKARLVKSLQRKPESPVYMMGVSEVLLSEDPNGFQIEPLVSKAAAALPGDPQAHYLYGQWACLNDRPELSIRELTRALGLTPAENQRARMQIFTYLGITYERLNQPANAEAAFRKAVACNQHLASPDPGALMHYAKFLQLEEREAEAQEVIEQILRLSPTFAIARLERANFLAREEKMSEALAEGELALKYAGDDLKQQRAAHALLARTFHALGRREEAEFHQKWIESHSRP